MGDFSSLSSLLTDTSSRLASYATNPEQTPRGLKQAVTTTNKTLMEVLRDRALPTDIDPKEIKKVLNQVNKVHQQLPDENTPLSNAIKDLKSNLTDLAKQQKEQAPVQLKGLGKTNELIANGLNKHLSLAHDEMAKLKNFKDPIPFNQLKELTKVVENANMALLKAEAFKSSPKGAQLPSDTLKVLMKILEHAQRIDKNVAVQQMVGAYQTQITKFKDSLKELQELKKRLHVLNWLKGQRGGRTALVEKETR